MKTKDQSHMDTQADSTAAATASAANRIPKFTDGECSLCGTPKTVVNGAWLRDRRKRAGLTLREMARRIGVSPAYICDIEHSRRNCLPAMRDAYENIASFVFEAEG